MTIERAKLPTLKHLVSSKKPVLLTAYQTFSLPQVSGSKYFDCKYLDRSGRVRP